MNNELAESDEQTWGRRRTQLSGYQPSRRVFHFPLIFSSVVVSTFGEHGDGGDVGILGFGGFVDDFGGANFPGAAEHGEAVVVAAGREASADAHALCAGIWYLITRFVDFFRVIVDDEFLGVAYSACVWAGAGGHTAEMMNLVEAMNLQWYAPRHYIAGATDKMSLARAERVEARLLEVRE